MCQDCLLDLCNKPGWQIEFMQKLYGYLRRFEMVVLQTVGNDGDVVQIASDDQRIRIQGTYVFPLCLQFQRQHFAICHHGADITEPLSSQHFFCMLSNGLHDSLLHLALAYFPLLMDISQTELTQGLSVWWPSYARLGNNSGHIAM